MKDILRLVIIVMVSVINIVCSLCWWVGLDVFVVCLFGVFVLVLLDRLLVCLIFKVVLDCVMFRL